uniref:Uncharacterized protein n=1 Tax=Amazona collaria TaxID=241587 RepID=A0A8B9IWF3_9PSIT
MCTFPDGILVFLEGTDSLLLKSTCRILNQNSGLPSTLLSLIFENKQRLPETGRFIDILRYLYSCEKFYNADNFLNQWKFLQKKYSPVFFIKYLKKLVNVG